MKGILEFDFPAEQSEFDLAAGSGKLVLAISEWHIEMRKWIKYEAGPIPQDHLETVQKILNAFWEAIREAGAEGLLKD